MRILKVINDELIDIREFGNANATFNTAEYRKSDDICIYHEQFNPFDLYSDYQKQQEEISRLNNIINELEKDIKNLYTYGIKNNAEQRNYLLNRLEGLKELKENNK